MDKFRRRKQKRNKNKRFWNVFGKQKVQDLYNHKRATNRRKNKIHRKL